MSVINYNPYGFDDPLFDLRDVLPKRLKEAYDDCFDDIGKYDSDAEWHMNLNLKLVHRRVRFGIWREFARVHTHKKKLFIVKRALEGATSDAAFSTMIKRKELCAYFFTRPVDHTLEARMMLDDAIENIRKILRQEIKNPRTGVPMASVMNAQLRAYQLLQDRVMGQTVQRIQQHTIQEKKEPRKTIDQIDAELKSLESKEEDETIALIDAYSLSSESSSDDSETYLIDSEEVEL